jgi:hypothetical protein
MPISDELSAQQKRDGVGASSPGYSIFDLVAPNLFAAAGSLTAY